MSPLIEYQCPNCQNIIEKIYKQGDTIPDKLFNHCTCCCGHMFKIISVPGFRRDQTVIMKGDNKL